MRRLLARPIRLDPARVTAAAPAELDREPAPEADDAASESVARLRTEMSVMKAIMMAERGEAARLRAEFHRIAGPDPVGEEARVVRDRWAALVDGLLNAPR
ncbi:hypothetical protein [Methylobacterium sp. A54F]